MVTLEYKKLRNNVKLPIKGSTQAGAYDLYASHIERINEREVIVYTGLAIQPPKGYRLILTPRSSFTKYNWVMQNSPGLGDSDYPGEYMIKFKALITDIDFYIHQNPDKDIIHGKNKFYFKYGKFPYEKGDRFAQMYIEEIIEVKEFQEVTEFSNNTDRTGGFGSTGK